MEFQLPFPQFLFYLGIPGPPLPFEDVFRPHLLVLFHIAPALGPDDEGDVEHDETVHELGDEGRAGRPEPDVLLARYAADAMVDRDVQQLADQEGHQRAGDHPQALSEDSGESRLHIGNTLPLVRTDPPVGRHRPYRRKREDECVNDEQDRQVGNEPHATATIVLVDDIGHHENERPQQDARGEVQRPGLPEERPVQWVETQRRLECKDLDANELSEDRVRQEEAGKDDEQLPGLV